MGLVFRGAILLALASSATGAELPQYDEQVHAGVGSCSESQCHGSQLPREGTSVMQNEYSTWSQYDSHRGAYELLGNEQSQRIARNLGLGDAREADICLDCHADNVPAEQRGAEFDITDGVTCEACHGGSEGWLATHDGVSHADNVANGLYPTDDAASRAELCLSCHLGTEDKFATHEIMGAGHPRLRFELSSFEAPTSECPDCPWVHWEFDDDYYERKGRPTEFEVWMQGLLTTARLNAELLSGELAHGDGLFPEVGLFDCHSCHHPMSDLRWQSTSATAGLQPGAIRINDSNFVILLPLAEGLSANLHDDMLAEIRALNRSVVGNRTALSSAATDLGESIAALAGLIDQGVDAAAQRSILEDVLARAVSGEYRDFIAAEQAYFAVDLLLYELGETDAHLDQIDALFAAVDDDESYRPARFASAADALRRAL